eukprot:247411-Amphidinium_carterae.1
MLDLLSFRFLGSFSEGLHEIHKIVSDGLHSPWCWHICLGRECPAWWAVMQVSDMAEGGSGIGHKDR